MSAQTNSTGRARVAAAFANQFAPKPPKVAPRSAIPQAFATHRAPSGVTLGVRLNGIRGSAAPSTAEIRRLIAAGGVENLMQARELVERLPSDHPEGWPLVRALFDALGNGMQLPRPAA